MTSTWSHIENELSVAGKSVADAPSAFLKEIQDDFANHKGELLLKNIEAAGLGIGMAIAFKAAPMTSLIATSLFGGYEAIKSISPAIGASWNANTEEERNQLGIKYGGALGAGSASMVETLPGFMLGSGAGVSLFERNPGLRNLTTSMAKPIEGPLQLARREFMAFHGKGVDMLPAAATAGGKIDALKMSETVQPTTEQEVGRAIDIKSGRVSKVFTGTRDLIEPPFPDKSGRLFIHTHVPDLGPRPGLIDARATTDMGIIRSGNYRSFFIGQAETKAGSEQLQALVLDDANKQAFLLNHVRDNSNAAIWQGSVPSYVDYNAARTTLQSLDVKGAWSQFMKLPKFEGRPLLPEHYNIATGKPLSAGKM